MGREPMAGHIEEAVRVAAMAKIVLPMASHVEVKDGLACVYSIDGTPIAFMAESVWNDMRDRA